VFVRKVQVVFVEGLGTEKEAYESSSTEQLRGLAGLKLVEIDRPTPSSLTGPAHG
jgi:hypothetical protein